MAGRLSEAGYSQPSPAGCPEQGVTPGPCRAGRPLARPGQGFAVPINQQWGKVVLDPHRCKESWPVARLMAPPLCSPPGRDAGGVRVGEGPMPWEAGLAGLPQTGRAATDRQPQPQGSPVTFKNRDPVPPLLKTFCSPLTVDFDTVPWPCLPLLFPSLTPSQPPLWPFHFSHPLSLSSEVSPQSPHLSFGSALPHPHPDCESPSRKTAN